MNTIKLPLGLSTLRNINIPRKHGILRRIYDRSLAKKGVVWVTTSAGIDWKLDLKVSNHRSLVYGDYEGGGQVQWIKNWLAGGGTVVDSGANIGQMLIYYLLSSNTKVFCIEPVPKCVAWLQECISAGKFEDRVVVVNSLFDSRKGVVDLKIAGEGDTGEWSTINTEWFETLETTTIHCEAITFDSLVEEQKLSSIRFWKLDVEGAEFRALSGAVETLAKQAVEALLVEIIPQNSASVNELLTQYGYGAHKVSPRGIPERIKVDDECRNLVGNILYLPI